MYLLDTNVVSDFISTGVEILNPWDYEDFR